MADVYDPTFWCKYTLCPECTEILLDGRRIRPGQKLPRDMRQCLRPMPASQRPQSFRDDEPTPLDDIVEENQRGSVHGVLALVAELLHVRPV